MNINEEIQMIAEKADQKNLVENIIKKISQNDKDNSAIVAIRTISGINSICIAGTPESSIKLLCMVIVKMLDTGCFNEDVFFKNIHHLVEITRETQVKP